MRGGQRSLFSRTHDSGLINFKRDKSQFTKARSGINRVLAGTGRSKWLFIGDSTTWGEDGGDTNGARNNAHNNAYPAIISKYMNTHGVPSAYDNLFGTGGNAGATVIADFRNSYKSGLNAASPWANSSVATMGGMCFSATGVDSTGFVYTPEVAVDSFEIGDLQASGAGVYTWQIDGGSTTQVTETNATSARTKQTISAGSRGTHTLTIKVTSGQAFIRHVKGWDSTTPQLDILNAGRSSSVTADWIVNTAPYTSLGAFTDEASTADLIISNLGINEVAAATSQATFKSNYQTIINAGIANGANFVIVIPHETDTTLDATASQANIRQWIKDLAYLNNLPCIDLQAHMGTFLQMTAASYMFGARHPNKPGYAAEGAWLAPILRKWTS